MLGGGLSKISCFPPPIFFQIQISKIINLEESVEETAPECQYSLLVESLAVCIICRLECLYFLCCLSMEEDFVGQTRSKGDRPGAKRSCSSQKCIHCLQPLSKRRILQHQSRCPAAKLSLPDGFKVEVMNGKTVYFCQCGYRGQRCRVLSHIEKCAKDKEAIASTKNLSSVAELEEYRHSGHFEPLSEA